MKLALISTLFIALHLAACLPGDRFHTFNSANRRAVAQIDGKLSTNAKRMAAGLPLLQPKSLHSPTRAGSAPRQLPSNSLPVTVDCNILVSDASDGTPLGYVAATLTDGYYAPLQQSPLDALQVQITYSTPNPTQINLLALNGPTVGTSYPYFGTCTQSDINSGSPDWLQICGTIATDPGSLPAPPSTDDNSVSVAFPGYQYSVESAIWTYNPVTQAITAQYINSDGSLPPTDFVYGTTEGSPFLAVTGDPSTFSAYFESNYPPSDFATVTFTCVPVGL